jgi:hypothetical protein
MKINFKPAQTLDQAREFSQLLGIRSNKIDRPELANWLNEGLANVFNATNGKAKKPDGLLIDDFAPNRPVPAAALFLTNNSTIQEIFIGLNKSFMDSLLSMANKTRQFADIIKLYAQNSVFRPIYHEMGHIQHATNLGWSNYRLLSTSSEIVDEYITNPKIQEIVKQTPGSAKKHNPAEFVAEVYAGLIDKIKLPKDIMDLYKKYSGPQIG